MVIQKHRAAEAYASNLQGVFQELDINGDGTLAWEEFRQVLGDPRVKTWLAALEIEVHEAHDLFDLLDNGNQEIAYDVFLHGAKRMKGGAQSVDLLMLMKQHHMLCRMVERIDKRLEEVQR